MGTRESSPAVIEWRWYYHIPSLGLWGVLVALLVLVKPNRRAQAWLIWLPVLAVSLGWSMLARLMFLSAETAEPFGGFLTALAASWAAVWLLAPWLARRRMLAGLALAMVAMLAVGGVYYTSVCDFGSFGGPEFLSVLHVAGAVTLLVATVLGAYRCRNAYRPRRFLAWLLLWMMVVPMVSIPLVALVVMASGLFWSDGLMDFLGAVAMTLLVSIIASGVLGVALYLLNLPFLFLAVRNPFYRMRFYEVLGLTPAVSDGLNAAADEGEIPAAELVMATLAKEPAADA
ncbi:MAG: hypothetical protein MUF25_27345 [Pirellulaceae bacterium]|nr:hypothetical protein [Pirellulaceae bacterium]